MPRSSNFLNPRWGVHPGIATGSADLQVRYHQWLFPNLLRPGVPRAVLMAVANCARARARRSPSVIHLPGWAWKGQNISSKSGESLIRGHRRNPDQAAIPEKPERQVAARTATDET